jgi:hypothetical protein
VSAAEAIDDSSSISFTLDQAGEAEFGEMLASYGWAAPGDLGQRGDVGVAVSECPQQPDPGGVGQEREGHDRRIDPGVFESVGMRRAIPVVRLALNGHVDHSSPIFTSSRMRI